MFGQSKFSSSDWNWRIDNNLTGTQLQELDLVGWFCSGSHSPSMHLHGGKNSHCGLSLSHTCMSGLDRKSNFLPFRTIIKGDAADNN